MGPLSLNVSITQVRDIGDIKPHRALVPWVVDIGDDTHGGGTHFWGDSAKNADPKVGGG